MKERGKISIWENKNQIFAEGIWDEILLRIMWEGISLALTDFFLLSTIRFLFKRLRKKRDVVCFKRDGARKACVFSFLDKPQV